MPCKSFDESSCFLPHGTFYCLHGVLDTKNLACIRQLKWIGWARQMVEHGSGDNSEGASSVSSFGETELVRQVKGAKDAGTHTKMGGGPAIQHLE